MTSTMGNAGDFGSSQPSGEAVSTPVFAPATASIPLVFVVGTGRCGTHTLWKLFDSVPNTLSTHEGSGMVRHGPASFVGKRFALGSTVEFNAYLYHHGGEAAFARTFAPDREMVALMDGCFAARTSAIAWCAANGIAYCDANPFAFNFINYLHGRFPHAKFIHLVRDGYACVRSWARRDASTYPDEVPRTPTAIPWLLAKPLPFPSDPAYPQWDRYDRVQKISWFWSVVNANIAQRLEHVPAENRRVVKIEEVTEQSAPGILEFCGLRPEFAVESLAAVDPSEGPALEWTPDSVSKFNAIASATMEKFGYPLR